MKGIVSLYNKKEFCVSSAHYACRYERNRVMEGWRVMYGPEYKKCIIGIEPIPQHEGTHENGINKRSPRKLVNNDKEQRTCSR